MMGFHERDQGQFFYDFCLDDAVPADHLVRRIAGVLDLSWVRGELAGYYSHTGRPSIDPELLIRMLLLGYVFAIRSERQLCAEVQVNLAFRWFCGLGIEDPVPDHSAFCRARHERFGDGKAYRRVFERVVGTCIDRGLVSGASMSVDASHIQADVNQTRRIDGDDPVAWPDRGEALNQSGQPIRTDFRGSILDADPPVQGVKIARRMTRIRYPRSFGLTSVLRICWTSGLDPSLTSGRSPFRRMAQPVALVGNASYSKAMFDQKFF